MGCSGSKNTEQAHENNAPVSPRGRFEGRIHILGAKGSGRRTFASIITDTAPSSWAPQTRDSLPIRQAVYRGNYEGSSVKWTVWVDIDYTAGAPEDQYWRDVDIILFMFAIDNKESFERLKEWLRRVDPKERINRKPFILAVVGTKLDQVAHREVLESEARAFAEANKMQYFEVSSKPENSTLLKKSIDDLSKELIKIREFLAAAPKTPRST